MSGATAPTREVLVIVGSTDHEGSDIVAVCSSPAGAGSLLVQIRAWEAQKPAVPDIDASDATWTAHMEAEQAWRHRFPVCGVRSYHETFTVERWGIDRLEAGVIVDIRAQGG